MFKARKELQSLVNSSRRSLAKAKQKVKELTEYNKDIFKNNKYLTEELKKCRETISEILEVTVCNYYGRTDKQKLQKIKELADANLTNSTILKHVKR